MQSETQAFDGEFFYAFRLNYVIQLIESKKMFGFNHRINSAYKV